MFPDWYGPPQSDWPRQIKLTGFPLFDGAVKRSLPPPVLEFVTNKKPTVLFTFGSGMMHAAQLYEAAARVCAELNVQGLFINRFFSPTASAPHMLHTPFLPFSEIFPHCAAVVHHGGIGTTAEAFAAATPQLILPLGFDQLDNGVRVQKLGAGLHTPSKHNFVAGKYKIRDRDIHQITSALRRLLTCEFRERAASVSKLVRRDALELAANYIESLALCDSSPTR
jgi:rhamnosyltransferase subunit B